MATTLLGGPLREPPDTTAEDAERAAAAKRTRTMNPLTAPTAARREIVEQRLANPDALPGRFQLSDELTMDIVAAIHKVSPRISDDELEAVLAGFEDITRRAATRAGQAAKTEAQARPAMVLDTRLERVDAALRALGAAPPDEKPTALAELVTTVRQIDYALKYHGLKASWDLTVAENPLPLREVLDAARRAIGGDTSKRMREAREAEQLEQDQKDREEHERRRVRSDLSQLTNEQFPMMAPPPGLPELAVRAIAETPPGDDEG